jgi:hypothetical protein
VVDGDGSPVVFWHRGSVDEAQVGAARTGARSAASISSWSFEEGRPERLQATVTFGSWRWHRFNACFGQTMASEDASDQGEEFRRKDRTRAYLGSSETCGKARRHLRAPARDFSGPVA